MSRLPSALKRIVNVLLVALAISVPAAFGQNLTPDQLRSVAYKAYAENRLYTPAGNNAMEYFLALRDKQPADAGASSALIDLLPMAVIATEQAIAGRDIDEAKRLVALIQQVDALHPALPRLKRSVGSAEAVDKAVQDAVDAAVAAADAAAAVTDSRWRYVGETGDGGVVSLDRKTIKRSGSDVTVWWKTQYESPQKEMDKSGDIFDEATNLTIFHCADLQLSHLTLVQRLRGKVIFSYERKSYEISRANIQPDTVGETVFDAVCGL